MIPVISPGQAILLQLKTTPSGAAYDALVKLYLQGQVKKDAAPDFAQCFEFARSKGYEVARSKGYEVELYLATVINNDPTRRYFESYLAYLIIKDSFSMLDLADIHRLREILIAKLKPASQALVQVFKADYNTAYTNREKLNSILGCDEECNILEKIELAYSATVGSEQIEFTLAEKEKIWSIMGCFRLCYLLVQEDARLTQGIYDEGFYHEKSKGRKPIDYSDDAPIISANTLGILKSRMPLPMYDGLFIKNLQQLPLKSTDLFTFNLSHAAPQAQFAQFTHPFVTSVSGSMLMVLMVVANILNSGGSNLSIITDVDKFSVFIALSASIYLLFSGAHSYYEFMYPVFLERVQREYKAKMPKFLELSFNSLLHDKYVYAVQDAIRLAIEYNHAVIKRQVFYPEMKNKLNRRKLEIPIAPDKSKSYKQQLTNFISNLNSEISVQEMCGIEPVPINIEQLKVAKKRFQQLKSGQVVSYNDSEVNMLFDEQSKLGKIQAEFLQ